MQEKEICWNITARCNQKCKYCHRFLNVKELSYDENKKILNTLIECGVKQITWTGGEALLLNYLDELIKISYEAGVKNKLISNGKLLSEERMNSLFPYLDSITLSLDSIDCEINKRIGRGEKHFFQINNILSYIKKNNLNIKIRINTVVNKINLYHIKELTEYLNKFDIYSWRIFKFMPLRELAILERKRFEISDSEFNKQINCIKSNSKIKNIDFRISEDMEQKYILILADGSIVITDNGKDKIIGNALVDSINKFK